MTDADTFLVTSEYRRFAEFCDACRDYRYIGLCHGPPGVGKTLSARHYAHWPRFEALPSPWAASEADFAVFANADAILYTPEIVNSPGGVRSDIGRLCAAIRFLREEPGKRAEDLELAAEKHAQDRRRFEKLQAIDWMRTELAQTPSKPTPAPAPPRAPLAPVRLVLVDEADRLRMTSLEQLRDMFDRNGIGMVLVGMPGMEKRLARYPQLYSRVGFVHAFRPLRAAEIRRLLDDHWREMGDTLPCDGIANPEAFAAIVRVTGGNFRLLRRLLSQIDRILRLNNLAEVTPAVVDTAREGLVIGTV